jgi:hypothetical protein
MIFPESSKDLGAKNNLKAYRVLRDSLKHMKHICKILLNNTTKIKLGTVNSQERKVTKGNVEENKRQRRQKTAFVA